MDVYEAITKRCSVRSYQERPVEQDKLLRVLEAGRLSPSARNAQNRKFVVTKDPATRQALEKACGQAFVGQAPVVIAVVTTEPKRIMYCGVPAGPVDCAIAIDHMTLAAVAEGLGTCWVGHFEQDACRKVLDVPDDAQIIEMLTLGYPAADVKLPTAKARAQSRKPLTELVCWESYTA
jgi:nitroreductase